MRTKTERKSTFAIRLIISLGTWMGTGPANRIKSSLNISIRPKQFVGRGGDDAMRFFTLVCHFALMD